MRGLGAWITGGVWVLAACGGRTALEGMPLDATGGAPFGGRAGSGATAAGGSANGARGGSGAGGTRGHAGVPGGAGGTAGHAGVPSGGSGGAAGQSGSGNSAGQPAITQKTAKAISAGVDMVCAVATDGSVWCWGNNDDGELGDGTRTDSLDVPVRVVGIDDAVAVTAGGTWNAGGMGAALFSFGCALLGDGTVRCWGDVAGIIAGASVQSSAVPLVVPGVTDAVAISGGDWHACALTRAGLVECWGDNEWGELGQGDTTDCPAWRCLPAAPAANTPPPHVLGVSGATAVSGKGAPFSCALLGDASLQCWGQARGATLAGDTDHADDGIPVPLPGISTTPGGFDIAYDHGCAISPDASSVRCWGSNIYGELGDGTTGASGGPVTVANLGAPVMAVSAGVSDSCAVLGDGSVYCWGDHQAGGSSTPVMVEGLTNVVAISSGYSETCALTQSGHVFCNVAAGPTVPEAVRGF
ncbi:MAG TPA: hypothetical protein VMI54_06605 [Polyangiaceae bacterium]|nr:hypothetical protein [Polyangiaceae bacterium]